MQGQLILSDLWWFDDSVQCVCYLLYILSQKQHRQEAVMVAVVRTAAETHSRPPSCWSEPEGRRRKGGGRGAPLNGDCGRR